MAPVLRAVSDLDRQRVAGETLDSARSLSCDRHPSQQPRPHSRTGSSQFCSLKLLILGKCCITSLKFYFLASEVELAPL